MTEKQYKKDEVIIREGDYGESFFQLVSGTAGVMTGEGKPEEQTIAVLQPGDYFGEMAVLEGYSRSATVKALEDGTIAIEIPGEDLNAYFDAQPDRIMALMRHLSSRIRQLTDDYDEVTAELESIGAGKDAGQNEGLLDRIRRFLQSADHAVQKPVTERTLRLIDEGHANGYARRVNTFPKGTVIFREGDEANCMFDIHWGSVGIYTGYGTPGQKLLTELTANRFFGEMGMIDGEPRSATAVTLEEDTTLETIYPEDLEALFRKNPPKVDMILRHLSFRLRRLTEDYTAACRKLAEAASR